VNGIGWAATVALGLVWLYCAIFNAVVTWRKVGLRQKRTPSMIPVGGGLAGFLALLICPLHIRPIYFLIPPLADLGCIPYLIWHAPRILREARNAKPREE